MGLGLLGRYGLALLPIVLAVVVKSSVSLQAAVDVTALLLGSVVITAWFGGWGPGLAAAVIATLAIDYYFVPPLYTLTITLQKLPRLTIFLLSAALVGWGSVARRRAEQSLQRAHDEMEAQVLQRTSALAESEARYRRIFQTAGVSIWEEDFSRVKAAIDEVRAAGAVDFRRYLAEHPEFVGRALTLVRIVDVNEATVRLFGAETKDQLLYSLERIFLPETEDVFAGELVALAEGKTSFHSETNLRTLGGDTLTVLFTMTFPPPPSNAESVLVSIMDVTERRRASRALQDLAGRLINAQEEERSRIGRELHDHVSQRLGLLAMAIDRLRISAPLPPTSVDALADIRRETSEITSDVHHLSHRLHSSIIDNLGLVPALQRLVSECADRHGIRIDFAHDSLSSDLPSDIALCLFRVVEESLANVAKHSRARTARVAVGDAADGIRLSVEDDGVGFQREALDTKAGLGFVSMRERLRLVGGTIRVESAPSEGARIDVWVPRAPRSS